MENENWKTTSDLSKADGRSLLEEKAGETRGMDCTKDSRRAKTDENLDSDAASAFKTQGNGGILGINHSVSPTDNITASTLSPEELDLLQVRVYRAVQEHPPKEVGALLSGLHPGSRKEVLQGSRRYGYMDSTFLTMAVHGGDINLTRTLLEMGADVNCVDGTHRSAMHIACARADILMMKVLIKNGARTDLPSEDANRCLMEACEWCAVDVATYLLDHGADPNHENSWRETPLDEVVRLNHLRMVKLLVAKGTDVNHSGINGTTPLHIACRYDYLEIAKYLFEKGARACACDQSGTSCLMEACMSKGLEVMRFLLESGVDPNHKNQFEQTALHVTAKYHCFEAIKLLVGKGTDVNLTDSKHRTALCLVCKRNSVEIAEFLLDSGARTDITDEEGYNCLMVACKANSLQVVQMLLKRGLDPNCKSPSQKTPLHQAALSNATEVAKLLLEHKAKLSADDEGHTPLVDAIFSKSVAFTEFLLQSPVVKRVEKAEALELLAANVVHQNSQQAYRYLLRAMTVRHSDSSDVLFKRLRPPVSALGNVVESQTLEELESRKHDEAALQWECLLAVERILGPKDYYVHNSFINACYDLCWRRRYSDALALWIFALTFPNIANSRSSEDFLEMLLDCYSPTFKEAVQILEAAILKMEQGTRAMTAETGFKCISIGLDGVQNQDERRILQSLVRRLIGAQSTDCHVSPLLHLAVAHYDDVSTLKGHGVPLVVFLLQCGADVNATDSMGNTALHDIVGYLDRDNVKIVCHITRILLDGGSRPDLRNNLNLTPLDCAVMEEVRALLRDCSSLPLQQLAALTLGDSA